MKQLELWEYAAMTQMAKEYGGPEEFLKAVFVNGMEKGYSAGVVDGVEEAVNCFSKTVSENRILKGTVIGLAGLLGGLIGVNLCRFVSCKYRERKAGELECEARLVYDCDSDNNHNEGTNIDNRRIGFITE